jgi:hypothetical protein
MQFFAIRFIALCLVGSAIPYTKALFDPYLSGPYDETLTFHWDFNTTGLYKNVEVYAPVNATGSFPVVYFSHSFAGGLCFFHHLTDHVIRTNRRRELGILNESVHQQVQLM